MSARPTRRERLVAALDYLGEAKRAGTAPAAIIRHLVEAHGATHQLLAWTNTLRVAGTRGTCTWSADKGLIENWTKLANTHLARIDGRVSAERERAA